MEVVRLFYTSLVNHTAYVFFISEQIEEYSTPCLWDTTLNDAVYLADRMRKLMCLFRNFAIGLPTSTNDSLKDAHKQIFNKELPLAEISSCSRKISYACSVLRSSLRIITELGSYLGAIRL